MVMSRVCLIVTSLWRFTVPSGDTLTEKINMFMFAAWRDFYYAKNTMFVDTPESLFCYHGKSCGITASYQIPFKIKNKKLNSFTSKQTPHTHTHPHTHTPTHTHTHTHRKRKSCKEKNLGLKPFCGWGSARVFAARGWNRSSTMCHHRSSGCRWHCILGTSCLCPRSLFLNHNKLPHKGGMGQDLNDERPQRRGALDLPVVSPHRHERHLRARGHLRD